MTMVMEKAGSHGKGTLNYKERPFFKGRRRAVDEK